mmetsp:Transcript_12797/g.22505  ORF Transcript_12797/g.22505 Transcript_12797/m.22505 type:complete len:118 (-) Transcript_12797:749-1102(-)
MHPLSVCDVAPVNANTLSKFVTAIAIPHVKMKRAKETDARTENLNSPGDFPRSACETAPRPTCIQSGKLVATVTMNAQRAQNDKDPAVVPCAFGKDFMAFTLTDAPNARLPRRPSMM